MEILSPLFEWEKYYQLISIIYAMLTGNVVLDSLNTAFGPRVYPDLQNCGNFGHLSALI